MKYIRTKDEILIAPELYDNGGLVLYSEPPMYETRNAKNEWGCVDCDEVIKQADTIEELCDEFVEIGKHMPYLTDYPFEDWDKRTKDLLNKKGIKVYGAIWTDKGLIYVAKMNDKGELELL